MRAHQHFPPPQPRRRTAVALMTLGLVAAALTLAAEQPEEPVASTEAVAREILSIQNELGGSIVSALLSEEQPVKPRVESPLRESSSMATCVEHLRDTAWQLDNSAHRLECQDLYRQADALRGLAASLRNDARQMKLQSTKSE